MTTDEIIKTIMDKIIVLPDQVGISKCAGFYMLYQGVSTLKESIAKERSDYETEISALKERIKELEAQVKE